MGNNNTRWFTLAVFLSQTANFILEKIKIIDLNLNQIRIQT